MKSNLLIILLILCPLLRNSLATAVDETLVEDAVGVDVVEDCIKKIRHSSIFLDDFNLLRRLAFVETKFGNYSSLNHAGGIWDVPQEIFESTKNASGSIQDAIKALGIDWSSISYGDLRVPLISALTVSIYIDMTRNNQPLQSTQDQAKFLVAQNLTASGDTYISEGLAIEFNVYGNDIDLTLIIGGSFSLNSNFERTTTKEKEFASYLLTIQSIPYTRIGLIAMRKGDVETVVNLNEELESEALKAAINSVGVATTTADDSSYINQQLKKAAEMIGASKERFGVPRVAIIFSNQKSGTDLSNLKLLEQIGVKTIVVSIGTVVEQTHEQELLVLAQNIKENIFKVYDAQVDGGEFDNGLLTLVQRLRPQLSRYHQRLGVNGDVYETTLNGNWRYFEFDVTGGVEVENYYVRIKADKELKGSLAYLEEFPSLSMYDFLLANGETKVQNTNSSKIYFGVKGQDMSFVETKIQIGTSSGGIVDDTTTTEGSGAGSTKGFSLIWLLMVVSLIGKMDFQHNSV